MEISGSKIINAEQEKLLHPLNGIVMLIGNLVLMIFSLLAGMYSFSMAWRSGIFVLLGIFALLFLCLIGPFLFKGLKIVNPNEALVLTLFGKYIGTIKEAGFFFVNPFASGFNPTVSSPFDPEALAAAANPSAANKKEKNKSTTGGKRISLKAMTLNNSKQKVNDVLGNPIEIGVIVIWKVKDTARAVFNVDNFLEFVSIQTDSALRNIARLYPYDVSESGDEMSLRGSSQEVAHKLEAELSD